MSDYWRECVSEALDSAGLTATTEQIDAIANDVRIGHECYGMAHGHDAIPNPLAGENKMLREALDAERELVFCRACIGRGSIVSHGPAHISVSTCWECNGRGRHKT